MIYLDNAATTQIDPEVLDAMLPFLGEQYGNPGGLYRLGREAAKAVDTARDQVAAYIGCDPEQVVFTSGGSEANNFALRSVAPLLLASGRTTILYSATEHHSVIRAVEYLEKRGLHGRILPVDSFGAVRPEDFREAMTEDVGLVSVMRVNNELGSSNTVNYFSGICKKAGVFFHSDCVQANGPLKVCEKGARPMADFVSISSHKLHGPKGVGAVFVCERSVGMEPLIAGGSDQEFGLRGGTENVAGIVGFGKACEVAVREAENTEKHIQAVKRAFMQSIGETNGVQLRVNSCFSNKIVNICFDGIDAQTLILLLDANGVCASAGSACNSHEDVPSHVLKAIGLTDEQARSSVRFSFSRMTSVEDAIAGGRIVGKCVSLLRSEAASKRRTCFYRILQQSR